MAKETAATRHAGEGFALVAADLEYALARMLEPWRVRLAEAAAGWRAAGYMVSVLDRAVALPEPPDVDGLLATFARAIARLDTLRVEAAALDDAAAGSALFRDPGRLRDAARLVAELRARAAAPPPTSSELPSSARDAVVPGAPRAATWTDDFWPAAWPDAADLLAGELA